MQLIEKKYRDTVSRSLSEILRHKPEKLKLKLDPEGYVQVNDLINAINAYNMIPVLLHHDDLEQIVKENNKQRFGYNEDHTKIRASQGHSVKVDLGLKRQRPPFELYHGTDYKFFDLIQKDGILKMKRQHVHLTSDLETAKKVGQRKGKDLMLLQIDAKLMEFKGFKFYQSDNGVWLTDHVPADYITVIPEHVPIKFLK